MVKTFIRNVYEWKTKKKETYFRNCCPIASKMLKINKSIFQFYTFIQMWIVDIFVILTHLIYLPPSERYEEEKKQHVSHPQFFVYTFYRPWPVSAPARNWACNQTNPWHCCMPCLHHSTTKTKSASSLCTLGHLFKQETFNDHFKKHTQKKNTHQIL